MYARSPIHRRTARASRALASRRYIIAQHEAARGGARPAHQSQRTMSACARPAACALAPNTPTPSVPRDARNADKKGAAEAASAATVDPRRVKSSSASPAVLVDVVLDREEEVGGRKTPLRGCARAQPPQRRSKARGSLHRCPARCRPMNCSAGNVCHAYTGQHCCRRLPDEFDERTRQARRM